MRPRLQRLVAVAAALAGVVAAPLPLAQAAWASETVENFTNPDDNAYDSGAVSSFSLDGITYTITETGPLADNDVTQDPSLQALADENSSDNALFFDEDDTGVISAVTLTMTDGKAFDIASLDIDVFADGTVTFLANGQSTSVSVSGAEEVTQTLELASADPVFADVTSLTIEGGNIEPALGHIVYSELSPPVVTTTGGTTSFTAVDSTTGTPVAVDPGVTVSDGESATLASGTVSISGNFRSGQDVLAFTNTSATLYGNISASYNASTGVLTLTSSGATATLAQWQAALRAVTYLDTAAEPDVPPRTVSFSVNDGVAGSATATKTLDVFSPPIVTTSGGTTNYAAGTAATVVDSGVTVTDPSRGTQASGTITIGAGFHSGDTLSFTNISASLYGNISASYNSGTGVLTLTSSGASATDAQWADALTAVTFATSATAGPRTVSFIVNDGTDNSLPATKTVDVSAAPVVTTSGGSTSFTAGDNTTSTPVAVDPGVTVSDSESAQLASGTVSITGNLHSGQDVLAFSNTSGTTFGDIAAAYNATTGVLTLTSSGATATLAQWQAALRAVTYTDTAITPNNATRTISFQVNDGTATSTAATKTVTVTAVDQTPVVTTSGTITAYQAGAAATVIDGAITVTDADNTTQASGTVAITSGFESGDMLAFANTSSTLYGNISASYNSGTGVLSLTSNGATATDAQWANAFNGVTFSAPSSASPGDRTVAFVANDGTEDSAPATDTVAVSAAPVVTTGSGSASFVAGDNVTSTPVVVDSGLTVTDQSSSTLLSATVSITGNFRSGQDVLAFTNTSATTFGNISAAYNATTGVLTLTSSGATATLAQWQAALRAVTYTDTAITPNSATRTVSFSVTDANDNTSNTATRTVTVTDVDQTPVVTTSGTITAYQAGAAATVIDGAITVTDADNTTQASGTVAITSGFESGDTLAFANTSSTLYGNISASYNSGTGVLSLTSNGATATDAQWANAFNGVTFSAPSSASPGDRTVTFVANDGTENSAPATDTVDVLAAPVVTTTSGSTGFTAGDNITSTPVAVDPGATVSDSESATLASGTVSVTANFRSGQDVLAFTNTSAATFGNVSASYNATTGVLTLTSSGATASLAQWQAALAAVTYTDTAITPNNATRTISFQVNDGTATSTAATKTVTVTDVDQTPVVTTSTGATAFVAPYGSSGPPVQVDPGVTANDRGSGTLAAGTVTVTANFRSGEDVLAFTNTSSTTFGNISASYDASTGVLTLASSGATATVAQWQAALEAVTYADTSPTPTSSTRTISFVVGDGTENSGPATKSVTVAQSPSPPPSPPPPPAPPPPPPGAAPTVTSLASSSNPSELGREVTLSVTVSPVPGGGTVTLSAVGSALRGCTALSLSVTTGEVDCSYTPSSAGTEVIDAAYSGDQGFGASTASLSEVVQNSSTGTTPPPLPPPASSACATDQGVNSLFVCRLYEDLFHRAPDAAGGATWSAMLQGGATRAEVARDILASAEYRRDLVASDYGDLFGHAVGSAGLELWVTQLDNGASDQSVLADMLGSAGYYARTGGTPSAFVNALYMRLLGRRADPAGSALWESRLSTGATRSSVALAVLSSAEYSRDFVAAQYERLLGHAPDRDELSFWVAKLVKGGSEASVIAAIVGSAEPHSEASRGSAHPRT